MGPQGYGVLEHQKAELREAGRVLDQVRPQGAADLFEALRRKPELIEAARDGQSVSLKAAMEQEAWVRASPERRADRFVEDWKTLKSEHARLGRGWEQDGPRKALEARMGALAGGLKRDPQLESLLRSRDKDLGVSMGRSLEPDLSRTLVRSLSLGRGLGISR